ncbi:MAG: ASKHA domain-containing protein [Eubacteriaceae bacterium]|nr:ASKHA domain-containing protein [Eubacteriaceae bacterium]
MPTVKVSFALDDSVYEAEKGSKLYDICTDAGFPQDLVCGAHGKCGKCAVQILINGHTSTVLACQYPVEEDITVTKISNLANRKVNVLTSNTTLDCAINPSLKSLTASVADFMPDHCGSFMSKIKAKFKLLVDPSALNKLASAVSTHEPDKEVTFIIFKNTIIDVQAGGNPKLYGLAVDIGTTTVAAYIYDMEKAEMAGVYSSLNQQTSLGADVISRIGYCIHEPNGTAVMRQMICSTLNYILSLAKADGIDTSMIYQASICGNSTMQHLFLGIYPESLGKHPFVSATHDFVEILGQDSLLDVHPRARVTFLPLLGGFVGADTTAVLTGLPDDGEVRLALDLGTNGEIAIGSPDRYITASTACGPALEGAGLSCGMRAADGAIEHFAFNSEKVHSLQVIGDVAATGICGSGIIDILACLIRENVINSRGKMYSKEEYIAENGEDAISERLMKIDGINAYILANAAESGNGEAVFFSQHDARQIQLAKAAIATGCEIVVNNYGIQKQNIKEVVLAGAFGNYLDVVNAQYIGLIPEYEGVPVRSIGNGAGTGVQMYLLDNSTAAKCRKIQKNTVHTELNFQEEFKDTYFGEMEFRNAADADE